MSFYYKYIAFALLFAALPPPAAAAPAWHRLEAARWELLTDTGEKTGAQVLGQLLRMQGILHAQVRAFAERTPPQAPPVRVLLFKSPKDFQPFQHGETNRGIFQSGAERDYILISQAGGEFLRAASHELMHLTLHHTAGPLPRWLEEGLAEYYSTAQLAGGNVVFGKPVPVHLRLLASEPADSKAWLDPLQFLVARQESAFYTNSRPDSRTVALYYAQSWVLVHVLLREPASHEKLARFLALLRDGIEQHTAFQQAFGRSVEQALLEARQSVAANRFPETSSPLPASPLPSLGPARELRESEALLARADALLAHGKLAESERLFLETARRWPDDPAAIAGLGYLAMRRGDYDAARRQLELAIARGDNQAATHFEYAMLVRDTRGPEALVVQGLRQAVQLSPSFAEAWYVLGATLLRQGNASEAADCLRRATGILPRQSVFWETYGRALLATGDRPAARQAARSASLSAATPEQAAMALGLLRDADAQNPAPPPAKPAVVTPKGWQPPQGDSIVSGRLVLVDCETSLLKFHIETKPAAGRTPAQKTVLATDKPNQVMLRGAGAQKREFVCGPQPSRPLVAAGYLARPPASAPAPAAGPQPQPQPAPPPKPVRGRKAPAPKRAPAAKPAKPAPPPIAGELVWLEFK